jgi:hypothetical protein
VRNDPRFVGRDNAAPAGPGVASYEGLQIPVVPIIDAHRDAGYGLIVDLRRLEKEEWHNMGELETSSPGARLPDAVPDAAREKVRELLEICTRHAGSNLLGLTAYGVVATEHFDPGKHIVRSVVILETVELAFLQLLARHGGQLGKLGLMAPLIMTPEYISSSCDTFPIELIEIQQAHITVLGEDYFRDLEIKAPDVRLQCERELKTLLIGMRQGLLAAAGRDDFLSSLETDIGEALVRTMRGMLYLKGRKDAMPARSVIAEVEELVGGGPLTGIRQAIEPSGTHGWAEFQNLYADIEKLGRLVDGWS